VRSPGNGWTSTAYRLIRAEEDADDLTDELIDRFGDPRLP
jgi:hypothetical protein